MKIVSYLSFDGQCKAAFDFYARVLKGEISFSMTWSEAPDLNDENPGCAMPEGWEDKIMHAQLVVGDQALMGSDNPADQYQKPQGIYVSLQLESIDEIERVYNELSDEADITMPLAETFWAERFAMLTDKFGIPWILNLDRSE